jgi:tetratricopeptide (TPR) repeat protein
MSMTLNLVDRLLSMGRNYQQVHRVAEALDVFTRLAALRELPSAVAEETQVRLAELQLKRKRLRKARPHLTAALVYRPDSAHYHQLMASALDTRSGGDLDRAAEHYRKSLEIEPTQPKCLCDYGLLLMRLGQVDGGLTALRRAGELAPDDSLVIGKLVKGLRLAELLDEARSVLLAARFRNPRNGRFRKLYNDLMFRQLRKQQNMARREAASNDEGPMLLPFVCTAKDDAPLVVDDKVIRLDPAEPLAPPHLPRPARRSDWKHG